MSKDFAITITNGVVEGVDMSKRAMGLRSFALGQGSLISSRIPILRGINFQAKQGERIAFIGSNGSGKSSLLKVIAGIYPLKSGQMHMHGKLAAIIEMGLGFAQEMTGRENIKLALIYGNMLDRYSAELEQEVIDFAELGEKIDAPIKNYSSGMLARLAFSIAITQEADILLLDEIFAAGDQHFVNKSLARMKEKFFSAGISLLVSHQLELIYEICNRCVWLADGQIIADGPPEYILAEYKKLI